MYQVFQKQTENSNTTLFVLDNEYVLIGDNFSDSDVWEFVREFRYDKIKFIQLAKEEFDIPDYKNDPEYVEYTYYFFGSQ